MLRHTRTPPGEAWRRIVPVLVLFALVSPRGRAQAPTETALGKRLAHEYEEQAGLGSTPELERITGAISSVGTRVASALPSHHAYHFIFDPNPAFQSAFALPDGYIIVGGGLLALARSDDELANALAHEIEHVELGNVSRRLRRFTRQKVVENLRVSDFFPGYGREQELACDLNGQKLAAKAGYSPAGMLTLLETFQALRHGPPEKPSEKLATLAERIAQAKPLAGASKQQQTPLKIP